jgi:hypothetical protein
VEGDENRTRMASLEVIPALAAANSMALDWLAAADVSIRRMSARNWHGCLVGPWGAGRYRRCLRARTVEAAMTG